MYYIPGYVSQGQTREEAIENIKDAIAICLQVRAELTPHCRDSPSGSCSVTIASAVPVLSGREVVCVFESLGWKFARQSASHIILVKEGETATLSVPDHREVAKGTLRSLIRTAGLTVSLFLRSDRGGA